MCRTPVQLTSTLCTPVNTGDVTLCLVSVRQAVFEVLGTIFNCIQIRGYVVPVGRGIERTCGKWMVHSGDNTVHTGSWKIKIRGRRLHCSYAFTLCLCDARIKEHKTVIRVQWFSVGNPASHRYEPDAPRRPLSLGPYRKFVLLNTVACKVTRAESMTVTARR